MDLDGNIDVLISYTKGLQDFEIVPPEIPIPYKNMGATIVDGMLQAGLRYETVVGPLVKKFLTFEETKTSTGFYEIIRRTGDENLLAGMKKLINWSDDEKPNRILGVVTFLINEGIETEEDLKEWLMIPPNPIRFKGSLWNSQCRYRSLVN
jgi:hypothetical protein